MSGNTGPTTKDTSAVALGLAQIRVGNSAAHIATDTGALAAVDSIGAMATTKFMGNIENWKMESGFPLLEDISIPIREAASLECAFRELTSYNVALSRGIDPTADVSATLTPGTAVTAGGGMVGQMTVTDAGGATSEDWTVVFTSATAIAIYGSVSGHVGDFADLSVIIAPDNGGNPYFSIPANFFDANWLTDETYTFKTTAFVAGSSAWADNHVGTIKLGAMEAPAFLRVEAVYTYPNKTNTMTIIFPRANAVSNLEIDFQAEDAVAPTVTFESKRADSAVSGGNAAWDDMPLGAIIFA
jgi:hypothetical protein